MPAICRAAAVNRCMRCFRLHPVAGFGAAAQPFVGKPDSYALRAEARPLILCARAAMPLLPGGRRSEACPRSAAQRQQNRCMRCFRLNPVAGFGAASQSIVGKPDSYALRAEAWSGLAREGFVSGNKFAGCTGPFADKSAPTGFASDPDYGSASNQGGSGLVREGFASGNKYRGRCAAIDGKPDSYALRAEAGCDAVDSARRA